MPNLLDIGTSAVLAYRTALTTTGENIANAETEGYARRDISIAEITGAQMSPTTRNSGGQGVQVDEVRRAYDGFLAERVRSTASAYSSSTAFATVSQAVEDLFLPSNGGIAKGLDGFFSALSTLSGNPSDLALRQSTLEAGRAMATSIADVASNLISLREDIVVQAENAADILTQRLSTLSELERGLTGASNSNGGLNPIFDKRDAILKEIAEMTGVTTQVDAFGRSEIRLGATMGGPILFDAGAAAYVTVEAETDLRLNVYFEGETKESTQISGGLIQGYRAALGAIDEALTQLNSFAGRIAEDINTLHASGMDLDGNIGGDLFRLEGWEASAVVANRGQSFVEFTVTNRQLASDLGAFTLVRDATTGLWNAQDASGTVLASGAEILTLSGLTVTVTGSPADGDRIDVSPVTGRAVDMAMVLTDATELAAAASSLVVPAATNTGTGVAVMGRIPVSAPAVDDLADILTVSGSGADAVNLLQSGVVGYVPAGATSLDLAALGIQGMMDFALTDANAGSASALSVVLGGTTFSFALSGSGASSVADLAAALNAGTLTTAAGESFADLGLFAAGTDGQLTLAVGDGDFGAVATLTSGAGTATGARTLAQAGGATVQVFTRNGVQIAGTPLDAISATQLLTTANGFFDGATYNDDYLYPAGTSGYRGMTLSQQSVPGAEVIRLAMADPLTWSSSSLPTATAAQTLTLSYVPGEDVSIDLPAGMSARRAAALIDDQVEGMQVSAVTSVGLTVSTDGLVSFKIEGDNIDPISISGLVSSGRMDTLAQSINVATGRTGITASLSPDGSRIVLTHPTGESIRLTEFGHAAGGTMDIAAADQHGAVTGLPTTLGAGVDNIHVTGTVVMEAPASFGVGYDSAMYASATDTEMGGLVERSFGRAGADQTFVFSGNSDLDSGAVSVDGLMSQAPNARYELTVNGVTVDYTGDAPAAGLASALRSQAPQSALTGGVVSTLPVTGAATSVLLGGDTYVLRMNASGGIDVSGPEEGRLTASFDSSNRLQIAVTDGTLDGAALRVQTGQSGAAAFGLDATGGPTSVVTGQAMDPGGLPGTMEIEIAGTSYSIGVATGGATLPGGFPGTASVSGGVMSFTFASTTGPVRFLPSAAATAAGFSTLGAEARVDGDSLSINATGDDAVEASIDVSALASQRINLTNLPPEDLIVVVTGGSPLRIAGSYAAGTPPVTPPSVRVEVTDAAAGAVRLVDEASGHTIAERVLDASRSAVFGDVQFALTGNPDDGDSFALASNDGYVGDSRNINAMAALRNADPTTGKGGFGRILAALQAQKGAMTAAANARVEVTDANRESAERVYSDKTDVNLDEQAARLIDQQQAYQAAAQILSVANELFDTLLQSL